MDIYNPETNQLIKSISQCPRIFSDYAIDNEFFINYNPEW